MIAKDQIVAVATIDRVRPVPPTSRSLSSPPFSVSLPPRVGSVVSIGLNAAGANRLASVLAGFVFGAVWIVRFALPRPPNQAGAATA